MEHVSSISIECPRVRIGRVIGKGGETFRALQAYTGAIITIDQTGDPTKITIQGTDQNVRDAADIIGDIVRGSFKGFALLRHTARVMERARFGNTSGQRPPQVIYVPSYGFAPASQVEALKRRVAAMGTDGHSETSPLPWEDRPQESAEGYFTSAPSNLLHPNAADERPWLMPYQPQQRYGSAPDSLRPSAPVHPPSRNYAPQGPPSHAYDYASSSRLDPSFPPNPARFDGPRGDLNPNTFLADVAMGSGGRRPLPNLMGPPRANLAGHFLGPPNTASFQPPRSVLARPQGPQGHFPHYGMQGEEASGSYVRRDSTIAQLMQYASVAKLPRGQTWQGSYAENESYSDQSLAPPLPFAPGLSPSLNRPPIQHPITILDPRQEMQQPMYATGDTGVLELTAEMGGLAPFRQQWEDPIVESNQLSAPVLGNASRQGSSSLGATSLPPSRRHSLPLIPGQLPPTTRNPSTSHPRSPTES